MNRKNKLAPSVIALYCRLSIEYRRKNEGMSISNQKGPALSKPAAFTLYGNIKMTVYATIICPIPFFKIVSFVFLSRKAGGSL